MRSHDPTGESCHLTDTGSEVQGPCRPQCDCRTGLRGVEPWAWGRRGRTEEEPHGGWMSESRLLRSRRGTTDPSP